MSPQDFALAALLGVSLLPTVCGLVAVAVALARGVLR